MRQPKRPRKSTTQPRSRWLAEILSRLSGPGGLYNLGDALGFVSGMLIASPAPGTAVDAALDEHWRRARDHHHAYGLV